MADLNITLQPTLFSLEHFIRTTLRPAPGKYIRASELYDRFRAQAWDGKDISDVKLAEHFGRYMTSKKLSCGKVWLDYEIAYDLDWTGPDETDVQQRELVIMTSPSQSKISLQLLGSAIRNLIVTVLDDTVPGSSIRWVVGNAVPELLLTTSDNKTFSMVPGLWLTRAHFHEISLHLPSGKRYMLQYDMALAPQDVYTYSNKGTYIKDEREITVEYKTYSGMAYFLIESKMLTQAPTPRPEPEPEPETYEWQGRVCVLHTQPGDTCHTVIEPALRCLTKLTPTPICVLVKDLRIRAQELETYEYYLREDGGYRAYMKIDMVNAFDLISNIRLVDCPLSEDLVETYVCATGEPFLGRTFSRLNSLLLYNGLQFVLKAKFLTAMVPKIHVLHGTEIIHDAAALQGEVRKQFAETQGAPHTYDSLETCIAYIESL